MAFKDNLLRLRNEKGLSLEELARQTGLSKTYLWQLEAKEGKNPSIETVQKISDALGVTIAQLVHGVVTKQRTLAEMPKALQELKARHPEELDDDRLRELASIKYRGKQPRNVDEWELLYVALKNTTNQ